eukprot:m.267167 g.267167  ORF g.267167 m.267167 type:complete len:198 (-) comp54712_c0_seq10:653-1246(-)
MHLNLGTQNQAAAQTQRGADLHPEQRDVTGAPQMHDGRLLAGRGASGEARVLPVSGSVLTFLSKEVVRRESFADRCAVTGAPTRFPRCREPRLAFRRITREAAFAGAAGEGARPFSSGTWGLTARTVDEEAPARLAGALRAVVGASRRAGMRAGLSSCESSEDESGEVAGESGAAGAVDDTAVAAECRRVAAFDMTD